MLSWSYGHLAVVSIMLPKPRTAKPMVEMMEGKNSLTLNKHDCEERWRKAGSLASQSGCADPGIGGGAMQCELAADGQPCEPCSWTRTSILNDALSRLLAMQSFTTYRTLAA